MRSIVRIMLIAAAAAVVASPGPGWAAVLAPVMGG